MRRYGYWLLGVVVAFAGVWATAEVSLHEFGPGAVIRSSEVNENFRMLAEALATKQMRIAGACAAGSSIRAIGDDGTVVCHVDQVGEAGASGVTSLNAMTGSVVLQAGANVSIDDSAPGEIVITAVGGGADGTSAVASDGTLTGDGSSSSPLGLADLAVTGAKLDDFGASPGQVLRFDGSTWVAGDDEDTTYSAGEGLSLSGTAFALDTAFTDARYVAPDGNGGFAVGGAFGTGAIPTAGDGVRLMWYPGNAAFRVGGVDGSQWNANNVGSYSVAMNWNTTASGLRSIATGSNTIASGPNSTAMGALTIAAGHGSVAMGLGTRALATEMVAIGTFNAPTGVTGSSAFDRPAFVVGNGTTDSNRSHALLLLANGDLRITGPMRVGQFPSTTGTTVCRTTNGTLANCSSSARLKEDVSDLRHAAAMDLVERLRPVSFRWRGSAREDLGLIAEEVASQEPRLVIYGENGDVEGVNYRHLTAVLIAALQHVQADFNSTLAAQRSEIEALQERLTALEDSLDRRGAERRADSR